LPSQIKSESVAALSITQANPAQQLGHLPETHLDMSPDMALEWQKIQRGIRGLTGSMPVPGFRRPLLPNCTARREPSCK